MTHRLVMKDRFGGGRNCKAGVATFIQSAVHSEYDGAVERVRDEADQTLQILGRLIETLHAKGVLSLDQVNEIAGYPRYELVQGSDE